MATAAGPPPDDSAVPAGGRTRTRRVLSGIARPYRDSHGVGRFMLVTGTVLAAIMVVLAVFAPLIAPFGFAQVADVDGERFGNHLEPGGVHLFGTTTQGFDVFSRVVWGARTAVTVVLLALVFSLIVGVLLGLVAGYVGRWVDRLLVMIMDSLFALPALLLAIVVAFLLAEHIGGGAATAALAITAVYVPQYFRVVRAATVSAKEQTYVEAARAMGARSGTIMFRYLLNNVIQSVPVIATLNAADAILTLAGLGFLGYGIQPTEAAEWGYDLQRAVTDAGTGIWWTGLFPGMAIVLLVMGLTLMGEGLNETINPAIRVRRMLSITLPERAHESRPGVSPVSRQPGPGPEQDGEAGKDGAQ
ncbi:ABC transporter permease [Actinobacteria bacterium YIM 96077]|uniref:ABC transporter permease n=1 Tax=Phytoactinopolyspora halophila TaxID=1981511 RepID=A0A329QJM1_9ACTN|nr:ABC transporter permease [Phytoactinopolyspora halophila]AYY14707.1 ABC transporter permease [Actinobacteria bacterium YIM 96077]RAW11582.1 ABC transporter permease [Phytoactinopolyspora halophila]